MNRLQPQRQQHDAVGEQAVVATAMASVPVLEVAALSRRIYHGMVVCQPQATK